MELPDVPEPSETKVRENISSEEMERMYVDGDQTIVDSWEIQIAIKSYLWKHWKETLNQHDIGWKDFQSETDFANNTIEGWANDRQDWANVLGGHAELLDADIQ